MKIECLGEAELENDHGDMEITLQKTITPRYADRKEPLPQQRSPATGRLGGERSVTGCLPEAHVAMLNTWCSPVFVMTCLHQGIFMYHAIT
jgi:hypothetical protein